MQNQPRYGSLRSALWRHLIAVVLLAASPLCVGSPPSTTISWRESTPAPEPRSGYASGVIGRKLLVIGGTYWEGSKGHWTKKIFCATTHVFDPATQAWTKLPDAPVTLGYSACAQVGEEIFVIGGVQDGEPSRAVWALRKVGGAYAWLRRSELPEERVFASAIAVGPIVYVLGGSRKFEPFDTAGTCCTNGTAVNTLWALDTADAAASWKPLAGYPGELRWGQTAGTDGAAIYMFGGTRQAEQSDPVKPYNEVLRYDLTTHRWSKVAEMPQAMQGASPAYVRGRFFLFAAGKKAMIFDPRTSRFSQVNPLPEDAGVDRFVWIDPVLVGATGETVTEGPRRRSEWTFIGKFSGP